LAKIFLCGGKLALMGFAFLLACAVGQTLNVPIWAGIKNGFVSRFCLSYNVLKIAWGRVAKSWVIVYV